MVVSSGAHLNAPFDFDDPHFEHRPYDPWTAYGQSKSADVLLAAGARRWAADGITANALNPGYVLTNLQRHLDEDTMRAFGVMDDDGNVTPLPYYKTPAQEPPPRCCWPPHPSWKGDGPLLRGQPGGAGRQENPTGGVAAHAVDPEAADRLWAYATEALRTP